MRQAAQPFYEVVLLSCEKNRKMDIVDFTAVITFACSTHANF